MLCSRKMFNFLIKKDARKILKRKDSDAGERGRALENLRASLFNELRSSEGAKRQQQRICGPTVALTFNFFVSVGIILINKLVLGKVGFNFPISLTFIHYIVSWFFMAILKAFSALPASPSSKPTRFSTLLALGIVMSLSTGFANVSLKYNSVGFYQMAKLAVTPSIVLAEFVSFGKKVSYSKVFALTVVSIGIAVATVTDLQFHFFGACVALAWIIPSATNKILWSNLQQQENWTALALMWKTTPVTLFFLVALMPWLDPPGVLSFNWNFSNTMAILMSAILGFLLQWSGALALGKNIRECLVRETLISSLLLFTLIKKGENITKSSSIMDKATNPISLHAQASSITPLNEMNFSDWCEQVQFHLGVRDLDTSLYEEKPIDLTDNNNEDELFFHKAWEKSNRLSIMFMRMTIANNIKSTLPKTTLAKEYMKNIKDKRVWFENKGIPYNPEHKEK